MNEDIQKYNDKQTLIDIDICNYFANIIDQELKKAESKVWHAHPVWFLEGNPIVGYCKQKPGIRLMFWSGADFNEADLIITAGKFKDASIYYNHVDEIDVTVLKRWLKKSINIQWDYKNIIKRKGQLIRLK